MFNHFMILPFILGVGLGIAGIYFIKPEQTITYKYPTPTTAVQITYKDKNGVCYTYSAKEVDCDKSEAKLKTYPLA